MLTEISPELAVQVLSFLDPCFVASNVFLVNKSWAVLANHAFLWRQFFEDKFGKLDDHFYYNDHNHQGEDEDDDADLSTYTNIWKQRFKKCFLDRCLSTWGPNSARLLDSYFKITDDPVRGECTAELEEDCAYVFLRSTGSLISASAPRSTLTTTTTDNKNIIRGRRHIFRIRIDCCKLGRSDDDDQEDDNHFEVVQHDNNQETTGNDYDPLLQQSIDEIYAQYYGLEDHHSGDPSSSSSYSDFPAEAHYIGPSTYPAYASSNDFFIGVTCADQYEQALREDESKGDDGAIVDHNGTAHWGWWGEFRNVWGFWNNNSIDNCDKRIRANYAMVYGDEVWVEVILGTPVAPTTSAPTTATTPTTPDTTATTATTATTTTESKNRGGDVNNKNQGEEGRPHLLRLYINKRRVGPTLRIPSSKRLCLLAAFHYKGEKLTLLRGRHWF